MKILVFVMLLATSVAATAQQTNSHFQHTETTTALPEAIWAVWTDVPNWHQWDSGLKSASLDGEFRQGAKGRLIPDRGPKSKFVIAEVDPGKGYTFKTKIPFGWLIIDRRLEVKNGVTHFTHDVQFTGMLKNFLGKKLGVEYRKMLPEVMKSIAKIAEKA